MGSDDPNNNLNQRIVDRLIAGSWQAHEAAEPDISTEPLVKMMRARTPAPISAALLKRASVPA